MNHAGGQAAFPRFRAGRINIPPDIDSLPVFSAFGTRLQNLDSDRPFLGYRPHRPMMNEINLTTTATLETLPQMLETSNADRKSFVRWHDKYISLPV
jgi:hypothetical protein